MILTYETLYGCIHDDQKLKENYGIFFNLSSDSSTMRVWGLSQCHLIIASMLEVNCISGK